MLTDRVTIPLPAPSPTLPLTLSFGPGLSTRSLAALVEVAPDGLLVVDRHGRLQWLNAAARRVLGTQADQPDVSELLRAVESWERTGGDRRIVWTTSEGRLRHLVHCAVPLDDGGVAVWIDDVTEPVRQQERIAAITSAAASVADTYSLRATLDAVAREIAQTAGVAAVQIHAFGDPDAEVRVLGMAGFGPADDFTDRLAACRRLGAQMLSIESFVRRERVVSPHRKASVLADPCWAPLHEIMGRPDWDTFVAVPLCVRGGLLGAVNVYYEPGEEPTAASLSFLEAMADQAAVAMYTANLLSSTRDDARTYERRRLARDLHDSAVQQVFSMRLQAESLRRELSANDGGLERLRGQVDELTTLAANALADLRALLLEMRPLDLADGGLVHAMRECARAIANRHHIDVDIDVDVTAQPGAADDIAFQEDIFRIFQEALHNVVKHSAARHVHVRLTTVDPRSWLLEVVDDGRAGPAWPAGDRVGGFGLTTMRERAESWGGHLDAGAVPGAGWRVRAVVPRAARAWSAT